MFIILDAINQFSYGGTKFELPSEILRYIEYNDVVVFWLRNGGRENHVVGVKFSQEGGVNRFYIAWEFTIDNWDKYQDKASYVIKAEKDGVPIIQIGTTDCVIYKLDPNTGKVLSKELSKW